MGGGMLSYTLQIRDPQLPGVSRLVEFETMEDAAAASIEAGLTKQHVVQIICPNGRRMDRWDILIWQLEHRCHRQTEARLRASSQRQALPS